MTWQQACDAIDQFAIDDRADYPAIVWYERQLDDNYEPDYDETADRADFEYEMWRDQ
jgi:hypothetical protein